MKKKEKKTKKVISDEYEEEIKGKEAIVYGAVGAGGCADCPYPTGGVGNSADSCGLRRL